MTQLHDKLNSENSKNSQLETNFDVMVSRKSSFLLIYPTANAGIGIFKISKVMSDYNDFLK